MNGDTEIVVRRSGVFSLGILANGWVSLVTNAAYAKGIYCGGHDPLIPTISLLLRPPCRNGLSVRWLPEDEGHRGVAAGLNADRSDAIRIDPMANQVILHRLGPLLGQPLVRLSVAPA